MELKRSEALTIFRAMQTLTSPSSLSIAFKATYAMEKNIRQWTPQITHIGEGQRKLMLALPEDFLIHGKEDDSISIAPETFTKPECKELADFLEGTEDFEVYSFDGEGLNSEENKLQHFVKVLYPLFS